MGLFNWGAKKEALEREVAQSLSRLPLLDLVIESLLNNAECPWLSQGVSYYDTCRRTVIIAPDLLAIEKDGEKNITPEDNNTCIEYSYTKSGYVPLHGHQNEDGIEDISLRRICYLWALVVKERMAADMPMCSFSDVYDGEENTVKFTYSVPPMAFQDWF